MKKENKSRPSRRRPTIAEAVTPTEPEHMVARSIFGHVAEVHRPRLVLFVGAPASSCAPVAALWFGALAAESKARIVLAYAAGTSASLSPELVEALTENGLDARRLIARTLTPELLAAADLVVTLSSGRPSRAKLPPTTRRREHWTILDRTAPPKARLTTGAAAKASAASASAPASKRDALGDARALRDTLRARVAMLVFSEGWGRPEISREDARVTRGQLLEGANDPSPSGPFFGRPAFKRAAVPEITIGWFPQPSLVPPSLR